MFNWHNISNDPNNKEAIQKTFDYLMDARIIKNEGMAFDYVLDKIQGLDVLDIGVCEHDLKYIDSHGWKHRRVVDASSSTLGIDIIEELVDKLIAKGFNIKIADATSNEDLNERFDAIVIGDVIEHVNSPVSLLQFSKRHLNPNGKIYITTPNPFKNSIIRELQKKETHVANLDHVAWFTPSQALELGRRSGVELTNYVCFINKSRVSRAKLFRKPVSERYTDEYLYIYS